MSARRAVILPLLVATVSACGYAGNDGVDPAKRFLGHWAYTNGATVSVCGGNTSTTALTGTMKISRLHGDAIIAHVSSVCPIDIIVPGPGDTVEAEPNQSCAQCVPADTCATLYQWKFSSFVLHLDEGEALTLESDVTATGDFDDGTPSLQCEQSQTATLRKQTQ